MRFIDIFEIISEDDKIYIESVEMSGEYNVDIVEFDGKEKYQNKIVAIDVIKIQNPRLVTKQDSVYLEVNVPDHPRGWSDYIPLKELKILDN
jgi:hypothetical protein